MLGPRSHPTTFFSPGLSTAGEAEPSLCSLTFAKRLDCVCLELQRHRIAPLFLSHLPNPPALSAAEGCLILDPAGTRSSDGELQVY